MDIAATSPSDFDQAPAVNTRNSGFRRYRRMVRMPAEEARRQSQVVQTAWKAIGSTVEAMAFLNTHHDQLGARPLELAMASDEGLVEVERILADTPRAEGVTP